MRLADREAVETWLEEKLRAGAAVPREGRDGGGEGRKEEGGEGGAPGREEGEPAQLAQEELLRLLDEVQAMIQEQQRSTVDKNKVREVDRRLKWARNPEKDPKSALCVVVSFTLCLWSLRS